jgi:hypothetical protein
MRERWLRCALGAVLVYTAMNFLSCMHERKLVGITVRPSTVEFLTPNSGLNAQFTALGTYIHPPDTRDITDKVDWKTDIPQLITLNKGLVSPSGNGCGVADISASSQENGNLVIAYATVTVDDPTNPLCPGGGTQGVLTVSFAGGTGQVTSVPAGINCPLTCGNVFTVGTSVILTAIADQGFTFDNWTGCDSSNGNVCTVIVPSGGVNVIANFH